MTKRRGAKVKRHNHKLIALSEYIEAEGMKLGDFAKMIEVDQSFLTRILNGEKGASLRVCNRIVQATCLEVRLEDLRPDLYEDVMAYNRIMNAVPQK